jgi:3-hydroxy-D-aspartate aldolase
MDDQALHSHLLGQRGSRSDLNSPSLIIELGALDRNIARMSALSKAHKIGLRPHAKTHKSVDVARRQLAAGALGVCCAKIGEAEVFADGGVGSIHITSPVVSAPAIARLVALQARIHNLMVVVDSAENVEALSRSAASRGVVLPVLIDVDPGIHRTGVSSAASAVTLSRLIRSHASLKYVGIQFYCALEQHIPSAEARADAIKSRTAFLSSVIEALVRDGIPPAIVTGGGTGSHQIDAQLGVFTELQVGSYVFMDGQYLGCEFDTENGPPFETALFVDARVVSANATGLVTVDAGLKAFASEGEPPAIVSGAPSGSRYSFMGDEHGAIVLPLDSARPRLGDAITLVTPHCDPTVNLYDTYHVVDGDTLVAIWPVSARGRSR